MSQGQAAVGAGAPLIDPKASRRAAKVLFGVFIVVAVGTFVWGFFVADRVRQRARETDSALRMVAWRCLCAAKAQGGGAVMWPRNLDELAPALEGEACAGVQPVDQRWPADPAAAMAGLQPPASASSALEIVAVEFAPDGSAPPRLSARGNPSGVDTLEVVNGWLAAYSTIPHPRDTTP